MKAKWTFLLLGTPLVIGLSSCATISKKSCQRDSWYDVGFKGAVDNHDRADHISDVTKICGNLGITVDQPMYDQGFAEGTARFCEPENGYQWGLKGRSYNGICGSSEFTAAYSDGYRIYKIQERRTAIVNRLATIRDRLATIDTELDDKRLTDDDKRKLEREENTLFLERDDLLEEQASLPSV